MEPGKIMVAGDWHGNTEWAVHVIRQAGTLLEEPRLILHLGDFGVWPGHQRYLLEVSLALGEAEAELWFIDGNHEWHPHLNHISADWNGEEPVPLSQKRIHWLPRGYRWHWHGRSWLALGGAVSPDQGIRTEGRDWWPEEEISGEQEQHAIAGGHADVMVTHDCPTGVTHAFPAPPEFWVPYMAHSEENQRRLQQIVDAVQPGHLMHGHLHMAYQRQVNFGYGPVEITGLDCEKGARNYAVLNIQDMTWQSNEESDGVHQA